MLSTEAAVSGLRDFPRFALPGRRTFRGRLWVLLVAVALLGAGLGAARGSVRLAGLSILALLSTSLPLAARALREAVRPRDPAAGAEFAAPRVEFGEAQGAVAALLVRTARGSAQRQGEVERATRDRLAYLSWDTLSRHVLVVGNTGSGKTTGVFNHLMLSSRVPWIYQDQKAELPLRDVHPRRPVWGLDTRGCRSRSGVWNPMAEVKTEEDLEVLSALLVPDRGDEYDWVIRGARFLFEALVQGSRASSLQDVGALLEAETPEEIARRLPRGAGSLLQNPRQRGYFLEALRETLHPFMSPRVRRVTEGRSSVELGSFIDEGGYVLANEDRSLRSAVTLFWGLLLHRLRSRPPSAPRLLLLLDEFGDAGRVPNMASALALYRSKNVGIVAGVQTHSLLKAVYGGEWEAVRDGFGTVLVLAANLPQHARERLSRELGERRVRSLSCSFGTSGPSVALGPVRAVDLVARDRWGAWGRARACLVQGQTPTWWIPFSVPLEATAPVPEEASPHTLATA
jgi:hypothetical protein